MFKAFNSFRKSSDKQKLFVSVVRGGCVGVVADGVAQFTGKGENWDVQRSVAWFALFGFYIHPVNRARWPHLLRDVTIARKGSLPPWAKVVADQTIFSPLFTVSVIFNSHVLERNGLSASLKKTKEELIPVICRYMQFWIPALTASFLYVPVSLRLRFIYSVTVLWYAYFSWFIHDGKYLK